MDEEDRPWDSLLGWEKAQVAYDEFDAWVAENDPDGTMDLLERINAYAAAMPATEQ